MGGLSYVYVNKKKEREKRSAMTVLFISNKERS